MALRAQLDTWVETFSGIALSAEDRFRDGQELIAAGRNRGAVYLLGLSAEMYLKLACYRLFRATAADPVGPHARNVRVYMDLHAPRVARESGHSLRYWAEFIIIRRANMLSRDQIGQIRHHIMNRLFMDWKIELRYRAVPVLPEHARRVLSDTAWLRSNWEDIVR